MNAPDRILEPLLTASISPMLEMGAYECLWHQPDDGRQPSFRVIADLFRQNPGARPSELVDEKSALACARQVLERFDHAGVGAFSVCLHGLDDYPAWLRHAQHPPEMLYFQGYWDLVHSARRIAIVGTRQPSAEGVRRTKKLVNLLVRDGYTIVSGLAKGVDTAAHQTAIDAGGETIAVIGTPLDQAYPRENAALQRHIANNFLLISQVPVLYYAQRPPNWNRLFFPERNITMSALTQATVIVEAGETSGTLTQARAALLQKRKLFILESNFNKPGLTWPQRFAERGAIRVRDFEDIQAHLHADTATR